MTYEAVIYFRGPLCAWSGLVDPHEVIYTTTSSFLPLAIARVKTRCRDLVRCGWVVRDLSGKVVAGKLPERGPIE
jgi:hypothetical protein